MTPQPSDSSPSALRGETTGGLSSPTLRLTLPTRLSLVGLLGAGLTAGGTVAGIPAAQALGPCEADSQAGIVTLMETSTLPGVYCNSVTLVGAQGVTISGALSVTKQLSLATDLTLADNTVVSVAGEGQIRFETDSVSVTGGTGASIAASGSLFYDNLIDVSGAQGVVLSNLILDGDDAARIIRIQNSAVSINSALLNNGRIGSAGGAVQVNDTNVLSPSVVTLTNSTVSNSTAEQGGGINVTGDTYYAPASLTIRNSTLTGNSAGFDGGAIYARWANVSVTNTTIAGNRAGQDSERVDSFGSGGSGGGIHITDGALNITHATIANNAAAADTLVSGGFSGGGIYTDPTNMTMSHSLVVGNTFNGQLNDVARPVSGPTPQIKALALSSEFADWDWDNNILSSAPQPLIQTEDLAIDYTLASTSDVFGDNVLADNGGPTHTIALTASATNPAVDAGTFTVAPEGLPTDQRGSGFARVIGSAIDIGAFEMQEALSSQGDQATVAQPVQPLLPTTLPVLTLTDNTLVCAIGEFSIAPTQIDVTLVVGGVRQETRRIAMPATSVSWTLDARWRGSSVTCEVVARADNRVATTYAATLSIPAASTPTPTPTPTPTTPSVDDAPARGFAAASVRFGVLSSRLDADDRRVIADLVKRAGKDAAFVVTGYVQATRVTANDRALSAARAQAVAAELRRLGVPASNIAASGAGRSQRDGAAARRATITVRWDK